MKLNYFFGTAAIITLVMAPVSARDTYQKDFQACGNLEDDTERLNCFDLALKKMNRQTEETKIAEKKRTEDDFGFTARDLRERGIDDEGNGNDGQEERPAGAVSKLADVYSSSRGGRLFILENGQIWQQTNISSYGGTISKGDAVSINRGAIGGYRMRIEGKRGFIGVKRIK